MNKKGINILPGTLIFLILNIVFFSVLFFWVARVGSGVEIKEQVYAKQIALLIDGAKPGTNLTLDISEMYEVARENRFDGKIVDIDYESNEVIVQLEDGGGYRFQYFSELNSGAVALSKTEKKLYIWV